MILSRSKNFLFLKTRKTAGTSIEIFLSKYCDNGDIITPITPIDELTRLHAGRICQNFHSDRAVEDQYRREYFTLSESIEPQERIRLLPEKIPSGSLYWNHMSIKELSEIVPDILPDHFFKFCVERHPYEKAISLATFSVKFSSYLKGENMNISVSELQKAVTKLIGSERIQNIRNYDIYTIDGTVMVDRVIDFSTMKYGIKSILEHLGLSATAELPFTKVGGWNKNFNANNLLTEKQKEIIYELCKEEFDLMQYAY